MIGGILGTCAALFVGQIATEYGRRTLWKHGVLRMGQEQGVTKLFVIVSDNMQILMKMVMATSDGLSKGDCVRILDRCPWKSAQMNDFNPGKIISQTKYALKSPVTPTTYPKIPTIHITPQLLLILLPLIFIFFTDTDLSQKCPLTLLVSKFPMKLRISRIKETLYITEIFVHPADLNIQNMTPEDSSRYDKEENRIGLSRTFPCFVDWLMKVDHGTIKTKLTDASEEHLRNVAIWMEVISPGITTQVAAESGIILPI